MAPKYRGNSDDWWDDENSRTGNVRSSPNKKKKKSTGESFVPFEKANAIVTEVFPNQCRARMLVTGEEMLCKYRRAQVFGDKKERSPVAVGDRALVERVGTNDGVISARAERRNSLARPAPDRDEEAHVIAANLDCLAIVCSVVHPDFSPGLVDRFLVAAHANQIQPIIVVNKIDQLRPAQWKGYLDVGYHLYEVSAKDGLGLSQFLKEIEGKTVAFCGHSGVGKTSLLNAMLTSSERKVGSVSGVTGKGRHTTTSAILLQGPNGSSWIDTPGVREFGLFGIGTADLCNYFPEFKVAGCDHDNCRHWDEEGCEVKKGADSEYWRYPSYRRIYQSLLEDEAAEGR
ncbi:ribosome small subunit-dependent GTPase A [bacterium]|jgi:ribosome biogenesis GTPase|nr:ribosome small subunit-dependent GTPase A [bacterium]